MAEGLMVDRCFNKLVTLLGEEFPQGNVGDTGYIFHSAYVAKTNKRQIIFFVTHVSEEGAPVGLTSVDYVLPLSEDAARLLYKREEEEQHVPPVYKRIRLPEHITHAAIRTAVDAYAAEHNLLLWNSEIHRVSELERTTTAEMESATGKNLDKKKQLKRAYHNLAHYWKQMRSKLYDAIDRSPILLEHTSSGSVRSSVVRRRQAAAAASSQRSNPNAHSSPVLRRRSSSARATRSSSSSRRTRRSGNTNPRSRRSTPSSNIQYGPFGETTRAERAKFHRRKSTTEDPK